MLKKMLSLLFLLLSTASIFAQSPGWLWTTKAGGNLEDYGGSITIDDEGNSYVTGKFQDTATFGSYSLTSSGYYDCDIFVAKMDANENWLWATKAGGNSDDRGYSIGIDDEGNSYVTGCFRNTATFGSCSLTSSGGYDIFVAKMDADGNWLWATKAGGNLDDYGISIAIDDERNSYVTGLFQDTATFGSYSLISSGNDDIFVAKMDADGNWLYTTKAGGTSDDYGYSIAIDDEGNSYVTGEFWDTATFGPYSLTSSGRYDIFVAKMDTNGNWLYATKAGGTSDDHGYSIAIDDEGNSYVTGFFRNTAIFGSYSLTSSGNDDIFVAKMDADGNWLYTTKAGGIFDDYGISIAIDDEGNSYLTGRFGDTATFGSYSLTSSGDYDIFVAKADANGNWLYAIKAGGTDYDFGNSIAIDDEGNSYVTGAFQDTATFGSYSLTSSGSFDIFVAKLRSNVNSDFNVIGAGESIMKNYPNPFNPTTTISFNIPKDVQADILIYNIKGQRIRTLEASSKNSGINQVIWNGKDDNDQDVASGVYFYKLKINDKTIAVKKCVLMK